MAILKRISNRLNAENNTGFGANSNDSGGRFYNRDGSVNVERRGIPLFDRFSWYHTMLSLPRWKFFLFIFLVYISINVIFATIYCIVGVDHLGGIEKGGVLHNFVESFFFSAQTFTTVGYGRISPIGYLASSIAAFEAFLGLLAFALATGLMFGRFAKPKAYLKFSHSALIAPYKEGTALMFRMTPYKNNMLTDAEVKVTLAMKLEENGKPTNKFFGLSLEISKVNALTLSWTIVHAIDDKSPLSGFTEEDFANTPMEVLVFVKAFDEDYSNTVVARTSYTGNEIVYGAKFKMMYKPDETRQHTVLHIDMLNDYEKMELPQTADIKKAE